MKRNINRIILFIGILVAFITFLYLQNNLIGITEVKITSSKIPSSFKGIKFYKFQTYTINNLAISKVC